MIVCLSLYYPINQLKHAVFRKDLGQNSKYKSSLTDRLYHRDVLISISNSVIVQISSRKLSGHYNALISGKSGLISKIVGLAS